MIAAIYARKSTGQHVAEDDKSVTRQVENATAFAIERGWTVGPIFIDDGVSGAETKKLLEKQRLLDTIKNGPPFNVLIMQAQDRFSRRGGAEAHIELKAIARAGVSIWFYADKSQFEHGTFSSETLGFLKGEFAAEFRRNIAAKTHEAMLRRAKLGHVTGGKVFGYDNERLSGHVERRINKAEAKIVREIYQHYADGEGFKQIAHTLNAKKLPSPRPQRGRPAGWDPGTVRAVLRRSLYRGVIVYNRTKKRDDDGSRHKGRQPKKPEDQWLKIDKPELRIVDSGVVDMVDARLHRRRHEYLRGAKGKLLGRPRGTGEKNLLAGFIVCECGATFEAVRGFYRCSARRRKGPAVCPSDATFSVAELDAVFLDVIEGTVLHPDFIDRIVDAVFADSPDVQRQVLSDQRSQIAREIENLTKAIAAGGDIPSLAVALGERDRRLKALDAKLAEPVAAPDRDVLTAALRLREGQWRDVLRGPHIAQARLVLQHLIELPLKIRWDENHPPNYIKQGDTRGTENIGKWMTQTRPGGMLVGLIQNVASPTRQPILYLEGPMAA